MEKLTWKRGKKSIYLFIMCVKCNSKYLSNSSGMRVNRLVLFISVFSNNFSLKEAENEKHMRKKTLNCKSQESKSYELYTPSLFTLLNIPFEHFQSMRWFTNKFIIDTASKLWILIRHLPLNEITIYRQNFQFRKQSNKDNI